jgi:hypothetical protein
MFKSYPIDGDRAKAGCINFRFLRAFSVLTQLDKKNRPKAKGDGAIDVGMQAAHPHFLYYSIGSKCQ